MIDLTNGDIPIYLAFPILFITGLLTGYVLRILYELYKEETE